MMGAALSGLLYPAHPRTPRTGGGVAEVCGQRAASPSEAYAEAAPGARQGLILFVRTFGDLANFNPHVHVLAADGASCPMGGSCRCCRCPRGCSWRVFGARCSRSSCASTRCPKICAAACSAGTLEGKTGPLPRLGGFSVHNHVRIATEDAEGRKKLAGYMPRAPMSLAKMTYDAVTGTVIYRSKMDLGLKHNFQVMPGAQRLALLKAAKARFPMMQ